MMERGQGNTFGVYKSREVYLMMEGGRRGDRVNGCSEQGRRVGSCGVRAIVKLPREGEGWESNHRLRCLRGHEFITAQLLLALRPVSSGRCSWRSD
jgi:hypothetical protein